MKFKFEYAVGGLLLLLFTIALLNLGSVREHLDFEQAEIPALLRGKCPEGCSSSSVTTADGKRTESCSKNDSLGNITKCTVLDKCLPGDVEKDGVCQYCQEGLKIVDGKCLPRDDNASLPMVAQAPCPTGCTFYNGGCLKDDAKKCITGELGRDDPICVRNRGIPYDELLCFFAPCPDNSQPLYGICRKCPAGKKLDNKLLCVPDPTKKVKDDNKKYIMYGAIAVGALVVIGAIMFMARPSPAPAVATGGKRRSR